ncbi:MAG: GntR family transcriptional regulator [Anaerovoracaceae bacterium]
MFQLDLKGRKSICDQIVNNMKELIFARVLETDSKIPSVRNLSKDLVVNPNTVAKAYNVLEDDGFIYTITGRGSFVKEQTKTVISEKDLKIAKKAIADEVNKLYYSGAKRKEVEKLVKEIVSERSWK